MLRFAFSFLLVEAVNSVGDANEAATHTFALQTRANVSRSSAAPSIQYVFDDDAGTGIYLVKLDPTISGDVCYNHVDTACAGVGLKRACHQDNKQSDSACQKVTFSSVPDNSWWQMYAVPPACTAPSGQRNMCPAWNAGDPTDSRPAAEQGPTFIAGGCPACGIWGTGFCYKGPLGPGNLGFGVCAGVQVVTPAPTPAPVPAKGAGAGAPSVCTIYGDPHVVTFDDSNQELSLVSLLKDGEGATGDVWLVKSDRIFVQGRYEFVDFKQQAAYSKKNEFMTAVAVSGPFLGGNTLVIQPENGKILWKGEEILSYSNSRFEDGLMSAELFESAKHVHKTDKVTHGLTIDLPMGIHLLVNRYAKHLGIQISIPSDAKGSGSMDGQCGNFNGDSDDDTNEMVSLRMGSMKVDDEESLMVDIM